MTPEQASFDPAKRLACRARRVLTDATGMMADDLAEELRGGRQTLCGIEAFDRRRSHERLRSLTEVALAFVERRKRPAASVADRLATIAAFCRHIAAMVCLEIDAEPAGKRFQASIRFRGDESFGRVFLATSVAPRRATRSTDERGTWRLSGSADRSTGISARCR